MHFKKQKAHFTLLIVAAFFLYDSACSKKTPLNPNPPSQPIPEEKNPEEKSPEKDPIPSPHIWNDAVVSL